MARRGIDVLSENKAMNRRYKQTLAVKAGYRRIAHTAMLDATMAGEPTKTS